jgi:hypothetical protein
VEKVVDWDVCTYSHWNWTKERAAETTEVLREERRMMFMHASILVDSVGTPSAEDCRTTISFP